MDQGLRTWYTPGKESGENCQCWAEVGGVKNEEKNVVAMVSWTVVELGSWRICSSFFLLEKQLDFEATKRNKNKT